MRPASKQQRLARSCSEFGRRSDRLRPVTGCTVSGRMVDSESTLQLSAEEFICSSHWKLLPLNQFRRCLGFGLISRLPIDNPGAWLGSGVEGRLSGTILSELWGSCFRVWKTECCRRDVVTAFIFEQGVSVPTDGVNLAAVVVRREAQQERRAVGARISRAARRRAASRWWSGTRTSSKGGGH
jgi:hypothetical protein